MRGILQRKVAEKSFAAEWAEYNYDEKEREDAKHERCFGASHPQRRKTITCEYIHGLHSSLKRVGVLKAMMEDRSPNDLWREIRSNGNPLPLPTTRPMRELETVS